MNINDLFWNYDRNGIIMMKSVRSCIADILKNMTEVGFVWKLM